MEGLPKSDITVQCNINNIFYLLCFISSLRERFLTNYVVLDQISQTWNMETSTAYITDSIITVTLSDHTDGSSVSA